MKDAPRFNLPMPTLGGKQFWQDVYLYGGWRIQRNTLTAHHRLLDPRGIRRGWGSEAACRSVLGAARRDGRAALTSTRLCMLLHGYLRSKDSFRALSGRLRASGYEVYSLNYPSTRASLETLSDDFAALLADTAIDFDEINVVTHSMGGIIARRVLAAPPPRPGRLVMIAPPNQGARMAEVMLDSWPSTGLAGPAGRQLTKHAESFARTAGTPKCPFGVIAGIRGNGTGWNPLIDGEDDGLVGVEDTRLEGMADFTTVRAMHTFIMNHPETIAQVLAFIERGSFLPAEVKNRVDGQAKSGL